MENTINILDCIPYGKENAITRAELVRRTGLGDRAVRDMIHVKREEGEFILSSSRARGYWRSDDPDEMKAFIRESEARIAAERRATSKLRERYDAVTGTNYRTETVQ